MELPSFYKNGGDLMRTKKQCSCRLNQEKLNSQLQKRLLSLQKIGFYAVIARFLSLLILILTYCCEKL